MDEQSISKENNVENDKSTESTESTENVKDAKYMQDGFLTIIKKFIESTSQVDQSKLSPQFLQFVEKLDNFIKQTENNYSFKYVFDLIAQHIKSIIYVNLKATEILGDEYSSEKYNALLSALVSNCNAIIDTFIVKDIIINIQRAESYAVDMPYHKADQQINELVKFDVNIITKSIEYYSEIRKQRESQQAEQQALVMQVMILLGGLDYKHDVNAKKILIKYWPSKANMPTKLNLNKVQQLSSIVATELIVLNKTIQDFIVEFDLDPQLLDSLKFTEEDLSTLSESDLTPELNFQLNNENDRIEEMKNELINNKNKGY